MCIDMSQTVDKCTEEKSIFDEIDVDALLKDTPGEEEAEEMVTRNK